MPALNEAQRITSALQALQPLLLRVQAEILVVDGGSIDGTPQLAAASTDRVLTSAKGRARQMNEGAAQAAGEYLLFLHADTWFSEPAANALADQMARRAAWGRFDVRLSGTHPLLRVVENAMNWRSRLSGIATGDQAMFVRREIFERVGGFPPIPLMEDIALSRKLKRLAAPVCLPQRVSTSSRRWEEQGIWPTILMMWRLRLRYALGADPAQLAGEYYRER